MRAIMAERVCPSANCPHPLSEIDNSVVAGGLGGKNTIEPGPSIGLDLGIEAAADFEVGSGPELLADEMGSTGPHALADVVP